MERAIASTSCDYEREYATEAEEFMLSLSRATLH
jgi:hypothetical protein